MLTLQCLPLLTVSAAAKSAGVLTRANTLAGLAGGALQVGVVDYREASVRQQVQIQLDAEACFQSRPEGGHAVFRHAGRMEPPVGILPAAKLGKSRVTGPALEGQKVKQTQNNQN